MRHWGIKQRLMALALLPGAIIGLALYSYFVNNQLQLLEQSLYDRGMTMARQLAPASEYGVVTGNTEILARLTTTLLEQSDVLGIGLHYPNGDAIFAVGQVSGNTPRLVAGKGDESVALCHEEKRRLVFCAPIRLTRLQVSDFPDAAASSQDAPILGYVQVEISTASTAKRRAELVANALAITGVVLFITGLFAAYVGYRISRPIVAITHTVREVGKGNLDVRLHPSSGGEIGTLCHGINAMISSLRVARDELRSQIDAATVQLRSALKELEEKNAVLDEQRQQAQAASLAKGQFLANMSHEIRTPLSGIIGMLDLLEKTPLQPAQRTYVMNLMLAADALHGLLNDILDLSRIEAGKLQLIEQWFNPHDTMNEVALLLAPSAHEKGLDLICHPTADFPLLAHGDSLRLRQVLINLIANAIKFTEQGRVIVRAIPLGYETQGQVRVRFEVEDTGIGIPFDKQQQVFESFTQIDNSNTRKHGGSGLGTTIARELVQLMGGEIGLQSSEGHGSVFWFELPWRVDVSKATAVQQPQGGNAGLLFVDRCPQERQALCDIARSLGLSATAVADEAQARAALAGDGGLPTVLLVENSPDASWLPLARELRTHSGLRLCHVTFFNGSTDFALFDGYLNKPVMAQTLHEALLAMTMHGMAQMGLATDGPSAVVAPKRALVAEDNHINALVIKSFLEQSGHDVVCVENGAEALAALEREPFDIVFMDMRMPELDGLEATRLWRAQEPAGTHLPIVALTANATVEDRELCLAAGMDDFLAKPVVQEQVLELIRRAQGVRR